MKKIIVLLFVLIAACSLQAQDSIPVKKWPKKKFDIMMTVSSCFAPRLYGEGILNDQNHKLAFGGSFLINYHFTRHIGMNWGFNAMVYNRSFGQINEYDQDTSYFTTSIKFLTFDIGFLWDINPEDKVRSFINVGASCAGMLSRFYFDGGSNNWTPPSRMGYSWLKAFYYVRAGIKIPLYKNLTGLVMLEYKDCFKPTYVGDLGSTIYTKPRFLSLHLGLSF